MDKPQTSCWRESRTIALPKFYRFYKLLPWGIRPPNFASIGFRWVFAADPLLLKFQIVCLEQRQRENPFCQVANQIRELQFYSRYLDSWALPLAKMLVGFQNWARTLIPTRLLQARESRLSALYQREKDPVGINNLHTKPLSFRPVFRDGKWDALLIP